MELELRSVEVQGAHEIGGVPYRGGRPLSRGQALGPLVKFLLIPKSASMDLQVIPRTFIFYT